MRGASIDAGAPVALGCAFVRAVYARPTAPNICGVFRDPAGSLFPSAKVTETTEFHSSLFEAVKL